MWTQCLTVSKPSELMLRLIFACTGFLRWLRVLNSLKGFESTGKPMLPILQAVPATGPFFFVVFCWFAAFVHLYYSFGLGDFWSGTTILYNLGFLAETSDVMLPAGDNAAQWRLLVDFVIMVSWRRLGLVWPSYGVAPTASVAPGRRFRFADEVLESANPWTAQSQHLSSPSSNL